MFRWAWYFLRMTACLFAASVSADAGRVLAVERRRGCDGFSIIELLVAAAIIAILAGLHFPVFATAHFLPELTVPSRARLDGGCPLGRHKWRWTR